LRMMQMSVHYIHFCWRKFSPSLCIAFHARGRWILLRQLWEFLQYRKRIDMTNISRAVIELTLWQ
jgi:hypothetical protein